VWVSELCVADVGEAVLLLVIPAVSQLRQPRERLRVLHLLRDQLADHVAVVNLDRADGHDLLSIAGRQFADQQHDQGVQLRYLSTTTTTSTRSVLTARAGVIFPALYSIEVAIFCASAEERRNNWFSFSASKHPICSNYTWFGAVVKVGRNAAELSSGTQEIVRDHSRAPICPRPFHGSRCYTDSYRNAVPQFLMLRKSKPAQCFRCHMHYRVSSQIFSGTMIKCRRKARLVSTVHQICTAQRASG